jgi:hypothetical protein
MLRLWLGLPGGVYVASCPSPFSFPSTFRHRALMTRIPKPQRPPHGAAELRGMVGCSHSFAAGARKPWPPRPWYPRPGAAESQAVCEVLS